MNFFKPHLPAIIRSFIHIVFFSWLILTTSWTRASECEHIGGLAVDTGHHNGASPTSQPFASSIDAIVAASNRFNPLSVRDDREYIGGILRSKRDGHFRYTFSAGETGQDTISAHIRYSIEYELFALWHTHGGHHWSREYFSPTDTRLAKRLNIPFYLADAMGNLKVFSPGDRTLSPRKARKLGLYNARGAAEGRLVRSSLGDVIRVATQMEPLRSHGATELALEWEQSPIPAVRPDSQCDLPEPVLAALTTH